MIDVNKIIKEFHKHGGILKTSELNAIGLNSRQIKRLLDDGRISKIKQGYYELLEFIPADEVLISRLFCDVVIFLESALFYYEYTDRIPVAWQIAVDRNSNKSQYNIEYPLVEPYYQDIKFLSMGVSIILIDNVEVKIFDRDRTMCDAIRYEKKLEKEVFTNAVFRYIKDPQKNIRKLFEYAEVFNITNKIQTHIGKWL